MWLFHLSFTPLSLSSFESPHKSLNINLQSFHPELLQPLIESISSGYNGALLLCGASTEKIGTLVDRCIIKQVEPTKKTTVYISNFVIFSDYFNLTLNSVSGLGKSVWSYVAASERGVVHLCVIPSGLSFYLIAKAWIILDTVWCRTTSDVCQCQFYPEGSAVDLLSPNRQTLKHVTHPVLGRWVQMMTIDVSR